jgi:UTP:GlnB (protein PII) uridylyltransferase
MGTQTPRQQLRVEHVSSLGKRPLNNRAKGVTTTPRAMNEVSRGQHMETRVRFIENAGALTVLEIESPPQHPLSYELPRTLGDLGLTIVGRETRMYAHLSLQRVQVTELDGSAISQERRLQLQSVLVRSAGQTPVPWGPPPDDGSVPSLESRRMPRLDR